MVQLLLGLFQVHSGAHTVKKKVGMSHQIWCNKAVSTVPPYLVGKSHQLLKVRNSHHLFTPNVVGCHTDISIICFSNIHNRKARAIWFHDTYKNMSMPGQ